MSSKLNDAVPSHFLRGVTVSFVSILSLYEGVESREVQIMANEDVKDAKAADEDKKDSRIKALEGALSRAFQHISDITHKHIDEVRRTFHPDEQPPKAPTEETKK